MDKKGVEAGGAHTSNYTLDVFPWSLVQGIIS